MELNAQYGNIIVDANANAFLRGSGAFNPPPNYEQTTDRGNNFMDALNVYENSGNTSKSDYATLPIYEDQLTNMQKEGNQHYQVGSTGIHPEKFGSWDRTEFGSDMYQEWGRGSIQQSPSNLNTFFFSKDNIDYLQNRIVSDIKRIKKVDISKQSVDELLIIMRNYYQKALSGWLPHAGGNPNEVYSRGETPCSIEEQLSRLNRSVLEETIKQTLSGIDMYMQYYKDASSLPLPLSLPTYTTQKGSRVLSENVGFNNGHEYTKSVDSYNQRYNIL